MRRTAFLLLLWLGAAGTLWGIDQETYGNAGVVFRWLDAKNDARSVAIAGLGSALAGEVNNLTINPASLGGLKGQQVAFMHTQGVAKGSSRDHLAYGLNLGGFGLGVSVDYLNLATIKLQPLDGASGTLNPHAYSVAAGFGKALGDWSVGLSAKLAKEDLIVLQQEAYAGDVGLRWRPLPALALAASVQNLGPQVDGFNLPTTLRGGLLAHLDLGGPILEEGKPTRAGEAVHGFNLGAELIAPWADARALSAGLGLEYIFVGRFALRAGYRLSRSAATRGPAAGAGVKIGIARLDYAWESLAFSAGTQRISAVVEF